MSVTIHPTAIVEDGAALAEGVEIGAFAFVGAKVTLGVGTRLRHRASVIGRTTLGAKCDVHATAVIGGSGQSIGADENDPRCGVLIGDGCTFREGVTIHAGLPQFNGVTRVGNNCYLMAGAHIAHDGHFGDNIVMANSAIVAGHVTAGDNVNFGGMSATHQFTRIGRNAFVGGGAILVDDVIPFGSVIGNRASLAGLNVVGLKRKGFSRDQIKSVRAAYKAIFSGDGVFQERLATAANTFSDQSEVMEIINFIRADSSRSICKPE